jgi:hypothetical protein
MDTLFVVLPLMFRVFFFFDSFLGGKSITSRDWTYTRWIHDWEKTASLCGAKNSAGL